MSAPSGERFLMKGNEALAEGAVRAGCRFFAGYPITPQNEVPEYMSWRMDEVGGVFLQAESEVAAINMLFGAAATGARTMTSSSGEQNRSVGSQPRPSSSLAIQPKSTGVGLTVS